MRRPPCHVARQLLEQRQRALAAAIAQCVGHFAARQQHGIAGPRVGAKARLAGFVNRLVTDQVGDVRNDPGLAGFDEPVVVELQQVVFEMVRLFGDHLKQRAQRLALRAVVESDHRRQQFVEPVGAPP